MKPDTFEQAAYPKCVQCGARDWRLDVWMMKRDTTATRCDCAGYHFPHRMGSFYCWHRPDGSDRLPGDVDFWTRDMTQDDHDALVAARRAELDENELPLREAA